MSFFKQPGPDAPNLLIEAKTSKHRSDISPTNAINSQVKPWTELFAEVREQGWTFKDNFFSPQECRLLRQHFERLCKNGELRPALVGAKDQKIRHNQIRNDQIHWMDNLKPESAEKIYLDRMFSFMPKASEHLMLPLNGFEAHFALYAPQGFYGKHLDRFQSNNARQLSVVLYLNENWSEDDGGLLRIYNEKDPREIDMELLPLSGRLVLFLSGSVYHEVLVAYKHRISITGWMKYHDVQKDPLSLLL